MFEDLEAIKSGQPKIEIYEVRQSFGSKAHTLGSGLCNQHRVTIGEKAKAVHVGYRGVIFDDEYGYLFLGLYRVLDGETPW